MAMMNTSSLDTAETSSVLTFLQGLQQRITDAVQAMEPLARFVVTTGARSRASVCRAMAAP